MKAVVLHRFGAIDAARVEDVPDPIPAADEILLDVAFAPVNFVDSLVLEGKYQFLPALPFTPGKGPVGVVLAFGALVERFKAGDRVLAMAEQGGYAQKVCVKADQCYLLPDSLSFEDAASVSLTYDTAWFALVERARMRAGERVLVLGATGGVGNAAIQLAKAKGAEVIAGVASPAKAGLVRRAGADHVVDLSRDNIRDSLRQQVQAVTGGKGVDIVIDPLGDVFFEAAIRTLAWRGRLVVIGFAAGQIPTLKVNYLLLKNIEVSGLQVSDYRKRTPELMRECFEDVLSLHVQGKLTMPPAVKFPLSEYAVALRQLLDRKIAGRAVLVP